MKKQFEEFNDGIVTICTVNADNLLEKKHGGLRFGDEIVGVTRHYAAQAADTRVDRVIHVIQQKNIKAHDVAVIEGEQYDVDKADHIKDTLPPITRLSLIEIGKHKEKEFA